MHKVLNNNQGKNKEIKKSQKIYNKQQKKKKKNKQR